MFGGPVNFNVYSFILKKKHSNFLAKKSQVGNLIVGNVDIVDSINDYISYANEYVRFIDTSTPFKRYRKKKVK